MAVKISGDLDFVKGFEKEVLAARKKAGRKIGGLIVRERRRQLGNATSRRKKAVKILVGREGTMVAVDYAPLALSQETGETIRARGSKKLLVKIGPYPLPGGRTFSTKQGFVFGVFGKETRLIGVLKSSVVIPRSQRNKQFAPLAEKFFPKYIEEIDKNLFEGAR